LQDNNFEFQLTLFSEQEYITKHRPPSFPISCCQVSTC